MKQSEIHRKSINTWDQIMAAKEAGMPAVAIHPRLCPSSSSSRPHFQSGWIVRSPGLDLSDGRKTQWYDHDKTARIFDQYPDDKKNLGAAMIWASDRFGPINWKRNRMRDYIPEQVARAFPLRSLKEKANAV